MNTKIAIIGTGETCTALGLPPDHGGRARTPRLSENNTSFFGIKLYLARATNLSDL
jgi:hypothetical protein